MTGSPRGYVNERWQISMTKNDFIELYLIDRDHTNKDTFRLSWNYNSHHAIVSGSHAFGCLSLAMLYGICSSKTASVLSFAYPFL